MIKIDTDFIQSDVFNQLFEKSELLTFKKGTLILKSGKICKYLFLVKTGLLRNFYYDEKGNDITHWFAKEDMLTTIPASFFNREPSFFSVEAIEHTEVYAFTHQHLEEAFQQSRVIERYARLLVTQIMVMLGQKTIDLQTKNAKKRYQELIANYPDIFRRANLGHIASYLGMTQQSLSRIRSL